MCRQLAKSDRFGLGDSPGGRGSIKRSRNAGDWVLLEIDGTTLLGRGGGLKRSLINLILVGGVAAISTSAVLIRLAQAQPAVIAFYRLLFATLLLAPWAVKQSRQVKLANRDFFCRFGGGAPFWPSIFVCFG